MCIDFETIQIYWKSYIKMELKDKYIIRNTKFRKSFG